MKLLADIGKAEDPVGCDSSHHSGMDWNVLGEYADYGGSFWWIGAKERGYVWDGMTALAAIEGANPGTGAASTEIFFGALSGWDSPRARFECGGTMPGWAEATWQAALPGGGALAWDSPLVDGSTRGVYGAAGEVLAMVGYAPYGAPSHTNAGAAPTFTYTGKPLDIATGLYHFPYRQYDPNASRWLTRDPLGMVDGPNVYAYVTGDPVGAVDLLGLARAAATHAIPNECNSTEQQSCMNCCLKIQQDKCRRNPIGCARHNITQYCCNLVCEGDPNNGSFGLRAWDCCEGALGDSDAAKECLDECD